MDTKNIALKVNSKLHDRYREYSKKSLTVSCQFEMIIKEQLKKEK